jgi:hypothetical protein
VNRRIIAIATAVSALLAMGSATPVAAHTAEERQSEAFGRTTLQVDRGTLDALTGLGVTPGAVRPGSLKGTTYSFPITSSPGRVLRSGVIGHRGGISLSAHGTTVRLTGFGINLLDRRLYGRVNGAGPVALLDLDYAQARVRFRGRQVRVGPVSTTLTAGAAEALNDAFGTSALSDQTVLGDATVRYRLPSR